MNKYEAEVKETGRLPAAITFPLSSVMAVPYHRARIVPAWVGKWSGRAEGPVGVFTLGGTICISAGLFETAWNFRGDDWSLSAKGLGNWAHELHHVVQWRAGRLKFAWNVLGGIYDSLMKAGILWSHKDIRLEQEAIHFGHEVATALRRKGYK